MKTIQLYIDTVLDGETLDKLKHLLMNIEHIVDVEVSSKSPHEIAIEYEDHHNMPIIIIEALVAKGYHPDIISG